MYNQRVLKWLLKIDKNDYLSDKSLSPKVIMGEGNQQVVFAISEDKCYFSVIGSPYLMAMSKWLQAVINKGQYTSIKDYSIIQLVELFDLPEHKRQDALLILQLIEQLDGKLNEC